MHRLIMIAAGCAMTFGAQAQLYRWVDENGVAHYGDRIPPKYSKTERQKLDESGNVRETMERQLTDAELAEKARQAELAEQAKLAAIERERYDQFLVSTYETPAALVAARDDRLATLDGQIIANSKSISDTERILNDLRTRAATHADKGRAAPASLNKQIEQWDEALVKGVRAVQLLRKDRAAAETQFAEDLERYMMLRGLRSQAASN